MNIRDALTLAGALFAPLGGVFILASHESVMWWVGMSLIALSTPLIGVRAILKDPEK